MALKDVELDMLTKTRAREKKRRYMTKLAFRHYEIEKKKEERIEWEGPVRWAQKKNLVWGSQGPRWESAKEHTLY